MELPDFIATEVLLVAFAIAALSNDAKVRRTATVVAGVAAATLAVLLAL